MINGTTQVKYRGIAFESGDKVVVLPPLNTSELEKYAEQLDALSTPGLFTVKKAAAFFKANLVPLVMSALRRNYPDLTDEEANDFVNMDNWGEIVGALLGTSKADKVRVGEKFPDVLPGKVVESIPSNSQILTGPGTEQESSATQDTPGKKPLTM